ncbi:hypothetical protein M2271_008567, partial [Streptomyces sp. LBL]|nr:hypothetical protein [Streptomyces sp. LBL]
MTKNNSSVEGPDGLVCTARLPLSSATLNWLADLIRGHLKKIGSRWRALPAGKIATVVLAVLRCDQRPGDLAGGNGVHRTTVTRWVREVVGLLASRAPRLDRALKKIARMGGGIVLLDGSVIRTRRRTGKEDLPARSRTGASSARYAPTPPGRPPWSGPCWSSRTAKSPDDRRS